MERPTFKLHLTINWIGKARFWLGVIIGVLFSFLLSYAYMFYLKSFKVLESSQIGDPTYFEQTALLSSYRSYVTSICAVLGFCLTVFIWFSSVGVDIRRYKSRLVLLRMMPMFIITSMLYAMSNYLVSFTMVFVHNTPWSQINLELYATYSKYMFLLPICIFITVWVFVRLIFRRVAKWIIFSFLSVALLSYVLTYGPVSIIGKENKDISSEYVNLYNKVDSLIITYERQYNITFSKDDISLLKAVGSNEKNSFLYSLKAAFFKDEDPYMVGLKPVLSRTNLKTILLENISVQTRQQFSAGFRSYSGPRAYVDPKVIYLHLRYGVYDELEVKALFSLLNEEIRLSNELSSLGYDEYGALSFGETVIIDSSLIKPATIYAWDMNGYCLLNCNLFSQSVKATYDKIRSDTFFKEYEEVKILEKPTTEIYVDKHVKEEFPSDTSAFIFNFKE